MQSLAYFVVWSEAGSSGEPGQALYGGAALQKQLARAQYLHAAGHTLTLKDLTDLHVFVHLLEQLDVQAMTIRDAVAFSVWPEEQHQGIQARRSDTSVCLMSVFQKGTSLFTLIL